MPRNASIGVVKGYAKPYTAFVEEIFDSVARGVTKLPSLKKSQDGFTRNDVVNAFQNAFEMIGGTSRLALWANQHPEKFYPLYAKLLPATTIQLGENGRLIIEHRIAPTELDNHQPVTLEAEECQSSESITTPDGTLKSSTEEINVGRSLSLIDELEKL